jgi:protoporphyrinogen oxidase
MNGERVAIIGGGMLGMTLALRLAAGGRRVTLIEGASDLGGLASAWTLGDVVWDRHYHVTLHSDSHLRGLLRELDLDREMKWVRTRTGFYVDGRLLSLSNVFEFLRFPPLALVDKLRLGATILNASRRSDWATLEDIPVADWLIKMSGRKTYEKIWLPLLRAKLGENYKKTSAAFIWAVIARMYAARRTGQKQELFGYVPGGYARVLGRLASALATARVEVLLQTAVRSVQPSENGVAVQVADGRVLEFDRVVLSVAAPVCAALCKDLTADERQRLDGVTYQGIVCASLLLRKPLTDFYVTNITDSTIPFTAVIEMSALVDRSHFNGNALVYLPRYVQSDDPLLDEPDEAVKLKFIDGLRRMYPRFEPDDVLSFRISRVRYVLPIPTLGYSRRMPPMHTSIPGVHIVNSAHILNGTLNVNETIALAERAAADLLTSPSVAPRCVAV